MKLEKYTYDGSRPLVIAEAEDGATKAQKEKRAEFEQLTQENIAKIALLQERLYAEGKEGLIFVLQARDAAGKDSTIKHLMTGINPQGVVVTGFKAPSKDELAHDFLWRFNKVLPARGMISILNRSYYEDVLVVRVRKLFKGYQMPARCLSEEDFFEKRYRHINNYEEELYDNGYQIVKIFLDASKETQKKRFLERIDNPEKNYKFSVGDLDERALWDDYTEAYEMMVNNTATEICPWYVVPSNQKWFARYIISEILLARLTQMDPHFPELSDDEKARLSAAREQLMSEPEPEKKEKGKKKKKAGKEGGKNRDKSDDELDALVDSYIKKAEAVLKAAEEVEAATELPEEIEEVSEPADEAAEEIAEASELEEEAAEEAGIIEEAAEEELAASSDEGTADCGSDAGASDEEKEQVEE